MMEFYQQLLQISSDHQTFNHHITNHKTIGHIQALDYNLPPEGDLLTQASSDTILTAFCDGSDEDGWASSVASFEPTSPWQWKPSLASLAGSSLERP